MAAGAEGGGHVLPFPNFLAPSMSPWLRVLKVADTKQYKDAVGVARHVAVPVGAEGGGHWP